MVTAYHNNITTVKKLISAKANVDTTDEHGNTALSLAACHGATLIAMTFVSKDEREGEGQARRDGTV